MSLKNKKNLIVGVVSREVLPHYSKRLSVMQGGGDDAIVAFEIDRSGVFEKDTQYI